MQYNNLPYHRSGSSGSGRGGYLNASEEGGQEGGDLFMR